MQYFILGCRNHFDCMIEWFFNLLFNVVNG
jgi:hypothetical protein